MDVTLEMLLGVEQAMEWFPLTGAGKTPGEHVEHLTPNAVRRARKKLHQAAFLRTSAGTSTDSKNGDSDADIELANARLQGNP